MLGWEWGGLVELKLFCHALRGRYIYLEDLWDG